MDSKVNGKNSLFESSSKFSKFNEEISRLDELGREYLTADPGWERDDIRFTELYDIVVKLSKPGGLSRWMIGTYPNKELDNINFNRIESVNFNLGVLLDKYRKYGEKYDSFFAFLYKSLRNAMLNDFRNFGPSNNNSDNDDDEEVQLPTTIDIDPWMQGAGIEDEEKDCFNDVPESKNDEAIISIVSCMIRFVLDLSDKKKQKRFLVYSMLYLTRYMLTGTRSYDYARRSFVHEDELISILDMEFIYFCMFNDREIYDTLAAICTGKLGMFHDMTKENAPYLPYTCYERDEWITDDIEYKVVSSYLYSVNRKGKDGGAKSTNRISEIFKDIEEKLKIRYVQEENLRNDDREIV